uniref:Uncharacterized protein n=1 Tax=Micromonas pusilla TaxID=38833 RepID=A0A7S0IAB1_MICPS
MCSLSCVTRGNESFDLDTGYNGAVPVSRALAPNDANRRSSDGSCRSARRRGGPASPPGAQRRSATDAAKPREAEGFSTTEGATAFASSSAMAMAIMETPEPTATPMPTRPPREMRERAV